MTSQEQRDALTKAVSGQSTMNYQAIVEGFAELGIEPELVKPRENVFTFHAWKALGRCVKKGEHGVKVCTWVQRKGGKSKGEDAGEGEKTRKLMPWHTTVFHISQTELLGAKNAA